MVERIDVGSIRRGQIVQAAMRVIGARGFKKTSLAEVEQEATIRRRLLTYDFRTKEDLIPGVFDGLIGRLQTAATPTKWVM